MKKVRPLHKITADLEKLLEELTDEDQHGAQHGEVLGLIYSWLTIHAPHAQEVYTEDKSSPIFFYGPRKN